MARSRLTNKFTYENWNKASKKIKEYYKEKYGKDLKENTAHYVTFLQLINKVPKYEEIKNDDGTVTKHLVVKNELKIPEFEAIIFLIKQGNNNCSDEEAINRYINYTKDENTKNMGTTGAMIDLICIKITY